MCVTLNDIYLAIADSEAYVEMPPRPVYVKCKRKFLNRLFGNRKPVQYSYQEYQYVLLTKQPEASGRQTMTYEFSYRQYRGSDHCLTIKNKNRNPVFVLTNGEASDVYALLMTRFGNNVKCDDPGIDPKFFYLAHLRYINADPHTIYEVRALLQRQYNQKSA